MKGEAKRGQISDSQLFFVLFTVRLYSLLLDVSSLNDFVFSFLLSFALCIAVQYVSKINKPAMLFLGIISILLTLQTVLSYVLFIKKAVHPEFSQPLLIVLIISSVIYAASLKFEALSRFSLFSGALLITALLFAVFTNVKVFSINNVNAISFENGFTLYNYVKCLDIPVIFTVLYSRINGDRRKALFESIGFSYAVSFVLLVFFFGVMGTAARVYEYPTFRLFQLSKIGSLSRLDIVFTGSVLLALFLKCSVLLYCGLYGITGGKFEKN